MKDYTNLVDRLNDYSASKQCHGGITAEAADAIQQLMREREALLDIVNGDCSHCLNQYGCDSFNVLEFPQSEGCKWEWDEDY